MLLLVPLAAFGGTHASIALPLGLSAVVCAILLRPRLSGTLDAALLLVVACIAFQLVPLPGRAIATLSPHTQPVRDALALVAPPRTPVRPLSIRAPHTEWALVVLGGAVAMFFIARSSFARGGVRRTVRGIAAIGFAVSGLAIAQAATAGRSIYWRFPTEYAGPLPFGPFINRNHFATWTIMALPLTVGYLMARSHSGAHVPSAHPEGRTRVTVDVDSRGAWLTASSVVMLLALLLSLSRSGIAALAISAAVTFLAMRRNLRRDGRWVIGGVAAAVMLVALGWADVRALAERLAAAPSGLSSRVRIWNETLPLVRDFWLTGTGAGTYGTAMLLYQRSDRSVFFNQAHNHYLQIAAEGGIVVVMACTIALVAFAAAAIRVVRRDRTSVLWTRAGAACGLGAVLLQSIWETGLAMPANAMLAATLAAIVLHEHEARTEPHSPGGWFTSEPRVSEEHSSSARYAHTTSSTRTAAQR